MMKPILLLGNQMQANVMLHLLLVHGLENYRLQVAGVCRQREGNSNYGVQCRKSINFVNAFVDVLVSKDFKDYFDYDEAPVYDLGSLMLDSKSSLSVLDASIGDYNGDFDLDLILLLEESIDETSENFSYYILAFYNTDLSSLSDQNQYVFEEINQGNCAASSLTRLDVNEDGFQDIMTVSESADKSLNKRGLCFFTGSEDGLVLTRKLSCQ